MVRKVLIDTNIVIDHLRQTSSGKSLFEKICENTDIEPIISTTVIQELFAGQSSKRTDQETKIRRVLQKLMIVPIEPKIAEAAGQIMRDIKPQIQFADAQIAAATLLNGAGLLTLNKKDFQGIPDLEFI